MRLYQNAYSCLSSLHLVAKLEKGLIRNKLFIKEKIRKNVFIKENIFQLMLYFTKRERLFKLRYV